MAAGAALRSGAALLGLSALMAQVAWLYGTLKLAGGVYLLYLAVRLWRGASRCLPRASDPPTTAQTDAQALRLGLLTNLTNPKALVFYGSIFAALLGPDSPPWVKGAAFAIVVTNAMLWHAALACFFATAGAQRSYRRVKNWVDRSAAIALGVLGTRLILPDDRSGWLG